MRLLTSAASAATMLVAGWMCAMYFVLRHPGYQWRAAVAAAICVGAAALLSGRAAAPLRGPAAIWGAALLAFGVWALASPGDDGWTIVAGALFVVEGALALLGNARRPQTA